MECTIDVNNVKLLDGALSSFYILCVFKPGGLEMHVFASFLRPLIFARLFGVLLHLMLDIEVI
jgi:hypothetical protein